MWPPDGKDPPGLVGPRRSTQKTCFTALVKVKDQQGMGKLVQTIQSGIVGLIQDNPSFNMRLQSTLPRYFRGIAIRRLDRTDGFNFYFHLFLFVFDLWAT